MKCTKCGGDCKEISKDLFKCKYCGSEYEKEPAKATKASEDVKVEKVPPVKTTVVENPKLGGDAIYEAYKDSIYEIFDVKKNTIEACATGFFASKTNFMVTNAHAVLDENGKVYDTVLVKINNNKYEALVVGYGSPASVNPKSVDLALLFVKKPPKFSVAKLGDSSKCKNGQKVYLIGNSLGEGVCITSGIISDANRKSGNLSHSYIMTDAAANQGNSGGPLIDEYGKTIGVLVAGIDGAKGMNYAIPVNTLKQFVNDVQIQSGLPRKYFGELFDNAKTYSQQTSKTLITIDKDVVNYITKNLII